MIMGDSTYLEKKLQEKRFHTKTAILPYEPIKCQCCHHKETSQLICTASQLTGFYMRARLRLMG